jgi:hypothetical protein
MVASNQRPQSHPKRTSVEISCLVQIQSNLFSMFFTAASEIWFRWNICALCCPLNIRSAKHSEKTIIWFSWHMYREHLENKTAKHIFDFHDIWRDTEKSSTEKTLKFSLWYLESTMSKPSTWGTYITCTRSVKILNLKSTKQGNG